MKLNVTRKQLSKRSLRGALLARLNAKHRAYQRDEDGGIAIIAFFIFLLMATMGGISIDKMNTEMQRTEIAATTDGGALAGAGAPPGASEADIKIIIEDFFAKSGHSNTLVPIGDGDIDASLNARRVSVKTEKVVNTYLMKLMGVDTIHLKGGATAEVRTPKLEVALVLDVSGSMGGSKLANLQIAAKEFVTALLTGSDPGDTVISIVPFSWTTAPGEPIFDAMFDNIDVSQPYSSCLRFDDDHYEEAFINPTLNLLEGPEYTQQIYTSLYGGFDNLTEYSRSCFRDDYAEILAYSMNEQELHDRIDLLHADGNTSTHIGMKWGAALLDPAFAPVAATLRADGVMDASLTNIPAAYNEPESMKIIVVMGDGANTTSYYFNKNGAFRGEGSDLQKVTH